MRVVVYAICLKMDRRHKNGSGSSGVKLGLGLNNFRCIRKWNEAAKNARLVHCKCGLVCDYLTSFTEENPGRRFTTYPHHNDRVNCGFWEWVDPLLCAAAAGLIPLMKEELLELRDTISVKESLIGGYETEVRRCHEKIVKLQDDLEVSKMEVARAVEEISKLETDMKGGGDKGSFFGAIVLVIVI